MLPKAVLVCFPGGLSRRESAFQCSTCKLYLWIEKISCWRKWQPIAIFLPEESHGQRSLVGCSPRGCKELDRTECWAQARKVHLTLYSRLSGSRWMTTPSWLSGSLKSFLYSFLVYSCHLFLLSSASVRFVLVLSFIVPIFAWNVYLRLFWSPFWDLNLQMQRPWLLSLYDSVHEMPTFWGNSLFLFHISVYIFKWNF